ncbi:MAG: Ribonuclease [Gemmatimonadetes bacterium]|nr:Ribonuclease [Gemmatimonadota bacterium]
MRVTFLGTAAARPTVGRNVSSLVVQREGDAMVFDCGEGTQRQMMRFGTGFSFREIFFTHLHADHFLGVIGLLRTLGLQGREEPMDLYTPRGTEPLLRQAVELGVERVPFEVRIRGLDHGEKVDHGAYEIAAFRTQHGGKSLGYAVVEHPRLGRFNAQKARDLGIPEGPLWGKLHHGQAVEVDGRTIAPEELVGEPRPGRKVVVSGDTRPCPTTREAAAGADLLVHEATFAQDEADRAVATGHSTARDAAELASAAAALRLALTHFSPRYADDPRVLEREARAVFPEALAAYDGLVIEVPYRSE